VVEYFHTTEKYPTKYIKTVSAKATPGGNTPPLKNTQQNILKLCQQRLLLVEILHH
jgi:hypothetical protein